MTARKPMTDFDLVAVLQGARDLLSDQANWTQGTTARDVDGRDLVQWLEDAADSVDEAETLAALHPDATRWCLGGALDRITGEQIRYDDPRFVVLWGLVDHRVGPWNDTHEHHEVLAALDEAIALAPRDSQQTEETI
jgi:hypothetical protein